MAEDLRVRVCTPKPVDDPDTCEIVEEKDLGRAGGEARRRMR
jgi:hypothetical protein